MFELIVIGYILRYIIAYLFHKNVLKIESENESLHVNLSLPQLQSTSYNGDHDFET